MKQAVGIMELYGRIVKGHKTIYQKNVCDACAPQAGFRDRLEDCLLALCRDADIPVPIWLSKNSSELSRFGKTGFYAEQFTEPVTFDRFEIKIIK